MEAIATKSDILDYWWFILAGRVCPDEPALALQAGPSARVFEEGDAFGWSITEPPAPCGAIADKLEGCQLVRVTKEDFVRAEREGESDTFRLEIDGELVCTVTNTVFSEAPCIV